MKVTRADAWASLALVEDMMNKVRRAMAYGDAPYHLILWGIVWFLGNLGAHLRKLEEAGFILVNKTFVQRKPCACVSATFNGRKELEAYMFALQKKLSISVQ